MRGIIHIPILIVVLAISVVAASATIFGSRPQSDNRNLSYVCRRYPNLPLCRQQSPSPRPTPTPTLSPSPSPTPSPTASPASTPSPSGLPAAPTDLAAKTNCQWQDGKYTASVSMKWKNNATNADGFKISQRKPTENNWTEIATLTAQEALDGPYGYYRWTNPEVNTDYLLRVGAFNTAGLNWSDYIQLTTACSQ